MEKNLKSILKIIIFVLSIPNTYASIQKNKQWAHTQRSQYTSKYYPDNDSSSDFRNRDLTVKNPFEHKRDINKIIIWYWIRHNKINLSICKFIKNQWSLELTTLTLNYSDNLICNRCIYNVKLESDLDKHIKKEHNKTKPFTCTRCNYTTRSKNSLTKHRRSHTLSTNDLTKKIAVAEFF